MIARGKDVNVAPHAAAGMEAERPPIRMDDLESVLDAADLDDGQRAVAWIKERSVIVYYDEYENEIEIRAVSATRRRLAP